MSNAGITFHPRLFNPLYWHLMPLLRDQAIRFIYIEGGSSASKTFTIGQALEVTMFEHNISSLIFRRYHVDIKDSVYDTFGTALAKLELQSISHKQEDLIKSIIGDAQLRFRGLDDQEKIKGIEKYDIIYNNEWSQFDEGMWDQQRKRLRGRPNQKFICDWNPVSSKLWQYENWLDKDEWIDLPLTIEAPTKYNALNEEYAFKKINKAGNAVWIKITYRDNFWIIGHPSGKGGFVDVHTLADYDYDRVHKPNLYRIYANGERGILRTGGEFWKQFDDTKHVKPVALEKSTIHVSLDQNVLPYVTQSIWQVLPVKKVIRQVHEIPCKHPDNNAVKAAMKLVKWLDSIEYKDVVFIYGDTNIKNRSTVDREGKSFFAKFIEVLSSAGYRVVDRVGRSNPSVSLSADFINEIYENNLNGWSIEISDKCKVSIDDYTTVKEEKDGTMQKPKIKDPVTEVTYEPHGHFSDTKRYFIIKVLEMEFIRYKSKSKKTGSYAGQKQ